jgi:hypothetical protein
LIWRQGHRHFDLWGIEVSHQERSLNSPGDSFSNGRNGRHACVCWEGWRGFLI